MSTLSQRLWLMRVGLPDLSDGELVDLDDAIALAKRYEDAPVLTVERVTAAGMRWNGVDVTDYADYGQRVRLVVEGG